MEGQEEKQNDAITSSALSTAGLEFSANQKYRYPWLIFLTM